MNTKLLINGKRVAGKGLSLYALEDYSVVRHVMVKH